MLIPSYARASLLGAEGLVTRPRAPHWKCAAKYRTSWAPAGSLQTANFDGICGAACVKDGRCCASTEGAKRGTHPDRQWRRKNRKQNKVSEHHFSSRGKGHFSGAGLIVLRGLIGPHGDTRSASCARSSIRGEGRGGKAGAAALTYGSHVSRARPWPWHVSRAARWPSGKSTCASGRIPPPLAPRDRTGECTCVRDRAGDAVRHEGQHAGKPGGA